MNGARPDKMQMGQCVSAFGGLSIDRPAEIDPAIQKSIVS